MSSEAANDLKAHVRFGAVDVSAIVRSWRVSTGINSLSSAELLLQADPSFPEPIDYFAQVTLTAVAGDREELLFTGSVIDAKPQGGSILVRCGGGVALEEKNVPPYWAENVRGAEIIYITARQAGLRDDQLSIQGLDQLPHELFEVTVPIEGLELSRRIRVGQVTFLPARRGAAAIAGAALPDVLRDLFLAEPVHALLIEPARRMLDAEQAAVEQLELVLGWLRVRAHYGLLEHPDQRPQRFAREQARTHPRRGRVTCARGLTSRRRWVRVPADQTPSPLLSLDLEAVPPALPFGLPLADRLALIACRRAAAETDPIAAATALSDVIEFFAASVVVPDLFDADELRAIKTALPKALSDEKRKRLDDLVGNLNKPTLFEGLLEAAQRDRVPLGASEIKLLRRIRRARNDAVHGRGASSPPTREELEMATSIVTRMLVFRIERRLRSGIEQPA